MYMYTFSLLSSAAGPSHNRLGGAVLNTSDMRPAARMGCLVMTLACPKPLSLYRPRDLRASDLWRLLDEHFDSFRQVYDEQFQAKYGVWRSVVDRSVTAFLKCGDPQVCFARVRCPDCRHEMFVAYSCKQRCTCPSCHQKRTLLTAVHVAEEVCAPVAHRQVVLTIPKRLRLHARFDRSLLGKLSPCAWTCIQAEVRRLLGRDDVAPGMIAAIQTHGELLPWHPHLHAIVCPVGVRRWPVALVRSKSTTGWFPGGWFGLCHRSQQRDPRSDLSGHGHVPGDLLKTAADRPGNRSAQMTVRGDIGWWISGRSWVIRATVVPRWTSPRVTSTNTRRKSWPWAIISLLFPSKLLTKIKFPISLATLARERCAQADELTRTLRPVRPQLHPNIPEDRPRARSPRAAIAALGLLARVESVVPRYRLSSGTDNIISYQSYFRIQEITDVNLLSSLLV